MINLRQFFASAALVAFSSLASAQPNIATGDYKLAVGNTSPCTLTLAANGTANVAACASAPNVGHWRQRGSILELSKANGEIYALLHPKGDIYAGTTFPSSNSMTHTLTLTPAARTTR
jgi:hypothetical protein